MKRIAKVVCSAVVSAALAATMAISAAAAVTYKDVVNKADACGFQGHNVTELNNFLEPLKDEFTSEQYDAMCKKLHECFDGIIAESEAFKAYGKDASELTDAEREAMFKAMTDDERNAIIKACEDAGKDFGVEVKVTKRADNQGYTVSASYTKKDGTKQNTEDNGTNPKTGDVNNVNAVAAVMSAIAIALAGTGIVVVAKKNREN